MKLKYVLSLFVGLVCACSAPGQKSRTASANRHYSAAFIRNSKLVVFPFEGTETSFDLPTESNDYIFSADGNALFGYARPTNGGTLNLVSLRIKPRVITKLSSQGDFISINSLVVDPTGRKAAISASLDGVCGLYEIDLLTGKAERIVGNVVEGCDYLSSWSHLSISPDGTRVVGTARKGQLGVVNLRKHIIEKLWPGTAAFWSPDNRSIAYLSFAEPMEIVLIDASDFSVRRTLGRDDSGQVAWSPDSRYLLLWQTEWSCGLSVGYVGTLETLDIESGRRSQIKSSRCKVNLTTTGWVSEGFERP